MTMLKGKVALISGGTKGIGKAIAKELASNGAHVLICGRSKENLSETLAEIKNNGGLADGQYADATKPEEVKKMFSNLVGKHGRLDILVNNVGGIDKFGGFSELNEDDWKRCYDLNFLSHVRFIRASLPYLKKSKNPRIINICTLAAKQPGFYNPHYSAAKAALLNLSKHLANILAEDKILVNSICLATVKTEVWKTSVENKMKQLGITFDEADNLYRKEEEEKNPLHQLGMPEDIAGMVAFLASEKSKWITGACFTVDGGTTRGLF